MEVCVCPLCSGKLPLYDSKCRSCGTEFLVARKGYCPGCQDIVDLDQNNSCLHCRAVAPGCLFELRLAAAAVPGPDGPGAPAGNGGNGREKLRDGEGVRAGSGMEKIWKVLPHLTSDKEDKVLAAGNTWTPFKLSVSRRRLRPSSRVITFSLLLVGLFLVCSIAGIIGNYRQHSVSGLVKRMESPDAAVRVDAARELARRRAPQAVSALKALLDDPESAVRIFAVKKLDELGAKQAAPEVAEMLKSRVEQEVSQAVVTAGNLREPVAITPLVSLLEQGRMVPLVEEALAKIGRPAVGALAAGHQCHALAEMEKKRPGTTEPLPSYLAQRDLANVARWFDYYIYLGRPGSEPVLVDSLEAYGGKLMAQRFMSCGNPVLEEAGRNWWLDNGYELSGAGTKYAEAGHAAWGN